MAGTGRGATDTSDSGAQDIGAEQGLGWHVWTYSYLEGTTAIDVVERTTGDLVYRAEVTAQVDDDEEDLDYDAQDRSQSVQEVPGRRSLRGLTLRCGRRRV